MTPPLNVPHIYGDPLFGVWWLRPSAQSVRRVGSLELNVRNSCHLIDCVVALAVCYAIEIN